MKFINEAGFFPLYVGDVQREMPGWAPGDPIPAGWHEVTPTERPPSDTTYRETLDPEPVDGFIPSGCEGIREGLTFTQHTVTAVQDPSTGEWVEEWHPTTTTYAEPYPIAAVKQGGEWLTPSQYIINNPAPP